MEILTPLIQDPHGDYRIGYENGQFFSLHDHLPPIPVSPNAAILANLTNDQKIRLGAKVPCQERRSPYDDGDRFTCPRCGFRQPDLVRLPEDSFIALAMNAGFLVVFPCLQCHGDVQCLL